MNIFVTGASGFLGTYFKNNNSLSNDNILYSTIFQQEGLLTFQPQYIDIEEKLAGKNIDVILHFASIIPKTFAETTYENVFLKNIDMMNNIFNYSVNNKIKKLIMISTFGSMQAPENLDIKDFYTLSKITSEHFCSILESKGIQTAALRIPSLYGEYSTAKTVLNIFIQKALNNQPIEIFGTGIREQNFLYVQDLVNALELCVNKDIKGVYSIVSEKNTTMSDLAKLIIDLSKSKSELIIRNNNDPAEKFKPNYNYHKAEEEIGYSPKFDIQQGLTKYINWILSNENSFNI